jgi:Spy/CpxP family protein refolding chaperone
VVRHHLGALALLAALALPLAASAQTVPAPGANAPGAPQQQYRHRGGNPALRGLNLTAAQRQQIAGMEKSSRAALRQQIEGVLTPDQRAQMRANLAQRRRAMNPNGPGPQAPPQ